MCRRLTQSGLGLEILLPLKKRSHAASSPSPHGWSGLWSLLATAPAGRLPPTCLWCAWVKQHGVLLPNTLGTRAFLNEHSRCFLALPAPESAPHDVEVSSADGSPGITVTWKQGTGKPWEYVVDWAQDGDSLDKLNWTRLPAANLSTVLPG